MEGLQCPICNSTSLELRKHSFNEYKLYCCRDCKVVFCFPFKAHDADFYTEADDILSQNRHYILNTWYKDHPTQQSENLKNGAGKSLLDLGCGNGAFVEFASQNGFDAVGIDFDTTSLKAARTRNFKTDVGFYDLDLEQYQKQNPDKKFDVITAFEVVEHLDNPRGIVELIHTMLKPGGLFIGTLPNFNRILINKIHMVYEIPPYHLTYWTSKTWTSVLESRFGFKRVATRDDTFCGYMSYQTKHKVLSKYGMENKNTIGSKVVRAFFLAAGFFEIPLEKLLKKGGSFYFEMRKS